MRPSATAPSAPPPPIRRWFVSLSSPHLTRWRAAVFLNDDLRSQPVSRAASTPIARGVFADQSNSLGRTTVFRFRSNRFGTAGRLLSRTARILPTLNCAAMPGTAQTPDEVVRRSYMHRGLSIPQYHRQTLHVSTNEGGRHQSSTVHMGCRA